MTRDRSLARSAMLRARWAPGYTRCVWWAAFLVAVGLYCAVPALGDLVQRSQLHGWTRTTGVIVAGSDGGVAVRYSDGGDPIEVALPGWLGELRQTGDTVETWVHPRRSQVVILADNTPLHQLPTYGPIGLAAFAAALLLMRRARWIRRAVPRHVPMAIGTPSTSVTTKPAEWLVAAGVPFAICLVALGWVVANPEIEGAMQLGLAALTYAAAMFGVHRWLRADGIGRS